MNNMHAHAKFYFRVCKTIFRIFGPKREKIEKMLRARDKKLKDLENEFRHVEKEFRTRRIRMEPKERAKEVEKFNKIEIKFNRLEKLHKQLELKNALNFLGLKLEPYEVAFFAGFTAIVCLLMGFLLSFIAFLFSQDIAIISIGMPINLISPIAAYCMVTAYPTMLARRAKVSSLAGTPEAINYMVISMRLSPSLDRAVEFAAENTEEPISSALKKILWDIYMKKYNSVEEALLAFAYDWGDMEDFKYSLYTIRSSTLERTEGGLAQSLDKANEIVLSGTKRRVEEFVSTLTTPTTVLFSLGVLLPLIIGAMLPMLSLGSMDLNKGIELSESTNSQGFNPLGIIFLMDVVFPAAGALYAYQILGKRPGTSVPLDIKTEVSRESMRKIKNVSIMCGLALLIGGIAILAISHHIIGTFVIIWSLAFPIIFYYLAVVRNQRGKRKELIRMEDEFPDALFQLGGRIAEGNPVESALKMASETMKGSRIGELFEKISFHTQIMRTTLEDALFGRNGILKEFPSRTIKASMKVVVELTKKDALAAGQTIISISNHLRDMKKIGHEIKVSLKSSVDSMKATGLLFAPLVMGVTSALYFLLHDVFKDFGSGVQMIQPYMFLLIIGLYLLFTVIIIMYFCTGIEHGTDPVERKYQTALGIPIALLVFTLTTFVANAGLMP